MTLGKQHEESLFVGDSSKITMIEFDTQAFV